MENLNVVYIQTDLIWENIDQNLEKFSKFFDQISYPTDLIVLPETFNTAFCRQIVSLAENLNDKTTKFLIEKAEEKQAVITGSFFIKEKGNIYNRMLWVRPCGTYNYYDKKHAFILSEELTAVTKGNELKTFLLKGWKIRPFICYDLRFPCWMRNRFENSEFSYDLLLCIANWPAQRASAWNRLIPARAIENTAYLVAVNRIGTDGCGNSYAGDSMVINYKGEVISKAENDMESINYVVLDYLKLKEFREKFSVHLDWDPFELK